MQKEWGYRIRRVALFPHIGELATVQEHIEVRFDVWAPQARKFARPLHSGTGAF